MSFSDFTENSVLNHVFKNTSMPQPAALYIALFTGAPTDAGGGTEVSGNGYARVLENNWDVATIGATANTDILVFPTASGGNWGTVTHMGIFDAISGGNLIAHSALGAAAAINDGDTAQFIAGSITVSLD